MPRKPTGQPRGRPQSKEVVPGLNRILGTNRSQAISRTTGANRLPVGPGAGLSKFLTREPYSVTQARMQRVLPSIRTVPMPMAKIMPADMQQAMQRSVRQAAKRKPSQR